ncbi:Trp operon repressor [Breznakia sp. PF5-3]|uniref:helix-turn-helix domain-containing protein n=1 Tax=unclassified Breznakia TaxID=2623764 RepID=UPI0024055041|nr:MULTISPECIES: helix-turn-helix domain-containing protein [unclassified Breznakia]MDF9825204.1 Trp operon repressor [Breznakia sp. PM6-1]MDF9836062.1 Trp operon repressor [Breznakia sp. PF5-3]MDF9838878.1 Trp operon repressor [Breznakia sp. PFB2-8]MDF9860904.1 Trp operon repressor [Breznakia sp. PH5-24]
MIELDFLRKVHAGIDEKAHIAITRNWNPSNEFVIFPEKNYFYDRLFKDDEFYEQINQIIGDETEDSYFSINSFRHRKKDSDHVWHLNAVALDFDFYKMKEYENYTAEKMYEHIKDKLPFKPTAVIDSGRGMYIIYAFKHCSKHMTNVYQSIYKTFYKKFEKYGMDPRAMNITQIIRIPGSFNSNALAPVRVIELNDTDYTIKDFYCIFPYTQEEVSEHKKYKYKNEKKLQSSFYDADEGVNERRKVIALELFDDFKTLIKLRNENGIKDGYRETLIYLVRRRCRWYGASVDEELKHAEEINQLFLEPLDQKELLFTCKPAGKTKVPGINWMIRNLGEKGIQYSEQICLKRIKSKSIKDVLYQRRKRKNKLLNITPTERRKLERCTRVAKLKNQGLKNKHIADILGVNKSTITRDLKYIRDNSWRFKKKLKEAMKEFKANINQDIFIRHTRYDDQKVLLEWLELSEEMLN